MSKDFNKKYIIETFDLTNGFPPTTITGYRHIYILAASKLTTTLGVRVNDQQNKIIPLRAQLGLAIKDDDMENFILSADPQPGESVTILCSVDFESFRVYEQAASSNVAISEAIIEESTGVEFFNVIAVVKDTEYSQALPDGCKGFNIKSRNGGTVKWTFVQGETSTKFGTLAPNESYDKEGISFIGKTIYFESDSAGDVVEFITYT